MKKRYTAIPACILFLLTALSSHGEIFEEVDGLVGVEAEHFIDMEKTDNRNSGRSRV